jgi:hypothetical protein
MLSRILPVAAACVFVAACSGSGSSVPSSGDKAAAPAAQPAARPSEAAPASSPAATGSASVPAAQKPERPSAASPSTPVASGAPRTTSPEAARPSAATASAAPEAPKAPAFRDVDIPAGRTLTIALTTPVASDSSTVEDAVAGTLAKPIVVSGSTVVPEGAEVTGAVLEANRSGRVKGLASVAFRFNRLVVRGETHEIRTARIRREAAAKRSDDVKKGAIGAGVGAVVGGIIGGGKGAAIGAGAGGTGAVLTTRGTEVRLPAGTTVTTTLQEPLTLRVPVKK